MCLQPSALTNTANSPQLRSNGGDDRAATAVVYREANFGGIDGKTANGLVRHSEKYEILSIIDSEKAGLDAGAVLDDEPNGIPICRDLDDALEHAERIPGYFIFGIAPATGMLSPSERELLLRAIDLGKIYHKALTLVKTLGARGIAVTGVTKAALGSPEDCKRVAPSWREWARRPTH